MKKLSVSSEPFKNFFRYFSYRFRDTWMRIPVITVIAILFVPSIINTGIESYVDLYLVDGKYAATGFLKACPSNLFILLVLVSVLGFIMPIMELSPLNNRKNLDTLYSLPVSKVSIALAHYLNGLIHIVIPYTASFLSALAIWGKYASLFRMKYFIGFYFAALAVGVLTYTFFSFTFSVANTTVDGTVISLLWIFAMCVPLLWIARKCNSNTIYTLAANLIAFSPAFFVGYYFDDATSSSPSSSSSFNDHASFDSQYARFVRSIIIWSVIAILCLIGFYRRYRSRRTETAGEVSTSPFGYSTLIPLYGIGLPLWIGVHSAILNAFMIALMIIGYVVFRRGFKFKKSDLIVLGVCSAFLIFGGIL